MKLLSEYLTKIQEQGNDVGWENFPPGWDEQSVKDFAKSLTDETGKSPDEEGWFDACIDKMEGHIDDPKAFCASVLDTIEGDPYWRGQTHKKGE